MSINFEALDLRAFVAVVDLEGFHRAAEALEPVPAGAQPAHPEAGGRGWSSAAGAHDPARGLDDRRTGVPAACPTDARRVRLVAVRDAGCRQTTAGFDLARLRADGGVLLPAVCHRTVQRAVPEHPLQDPGPVRERGLGERGAWRGRVRHQPSRARPIRSCRSSP